MQAEPVVIILRQRQSPKGSTSLPSLVRNSSVGSLLKSCHFFQPFLNHWSQNHPKIYEETVKPLNDPFFAGEHWIF